MNAHANDERGFVAYFAPPAMLAAILVSGTLGIDGAAVLVPIAALFALSMGLAVLGARTGVIADPTGHPWLKRLGWLLVVPAIAAGVLLRPDDAAWWQVPIAAFGVWLIGYTAAASLTAFAAARRAG